MSETASRALARIRACGGWLKPSLADLFYFFLLLAIFGRPQSWMALLADGDTGWHIRTGDYILHTGKVPLVDLFSFSRPGHPWFAWEWLADVCFAGLNRWHGLEAVAAFSALVICLSAVCLLCWLLRRGVGLWVAVAVVLATVSESSIHALARPHIFSLLLVTLGLWVLDEDRRSPGRLVWVLAPLSAVWANLHAGFVAWLAILGLRVVVSAFERNRREFVRYGALAILCSAATLVNPYGWRLHEHIVRYLGSSWILDHVQEFQSPRIRSESMVVFAVMLLVGVALTSRAFARREWFDGLLVILWGYASLRSARHIPLYGIVAAPLIASECASWWSRRAAECSRRSVVRVFWELSQEFGRVRRVSWWAAALGGLAIWTTMPQGQLADFPAISFPVAAVSANLGRFDPGGGMPRVLTSDQWADYLIFRLYPRARVFFDGRSDFYGPGIGGDYHTLLSMGPGWREALERYRFEMALIPKDWALGDILAHSPEWKVVYQDGVSALLVRQAEISHISSKETRPDCRTYNCD